MDWVFPEEKIKEATRCPHGHSCLKSQRCGTEASCPVQAADGLNVLFLGQDDLRTCPYKMSFGQGHICTCPIRYAAFKKYGR